MLYTCQLSVTLPNRQAPRLPRTPQDLQDTQAPSRLPALRRHSVPNPHNRHAACPEFSRQRPHRPTCAGLSRIRASSDSLGVSLCVTGIKSCIHTFRIPFSQPDSRSPSECRSRQPSHSCGRKPWRRLARWPGCVLAWLRTGPSCSGAEAPH